jgi:hypothetical protein
VLGVYQTKAGIFFWWPRRCRGNLIRRDVIEERDTTALYLTDSTITQPQSTPERWFFINSCSPAAALARSCYIIHTLHGDGVMFWIFSKVDVEDLICSRWMFVSAPAEIKNAATFTNNCSPFRKHSSPLKLHRTHKIKRCARINLQFHYVKKALFCL